jgi:uncharacterized protein
MKKKFLTIIVFLVLVFGFNNISYASTNTEERTRDNLKINSDYELTENTITAVLNTPKVDATEKVYDFADVFTEKQEKALYKKIKNYIKFNNMDMAIVTISENNKNSAMDYADDFYDYNDFGIGDERDGILMLIDMDTREVWISTTGKAMMVYDSYTIDKMLDGIFRKSPLTDSYWCAKKFVSVSFYYNKKQLIFSVLGCMLIAGAITFIVIKVQCDKHKTVYKKFSGEDYLQKGSFILDINTDRYITTRRARVMINNNMGGPGGPHSHRWRRRLSY